MTTNPTVPTAAPTRSSIGGAHLVTGTTTAWAMIMPIPIASITTPDS